MKRMCLLGFMFHSPMNHTILSWAHPESTQGTEFARPELWQGVARTLERGKFDGLFLADTFSAYDVYQDSYEPTVRYAVVCPRHDPVVPILQERGLVRREYTARTFREQLLED